jgi:hypothetical protein
MARRFPHSTATRWLPRCWPAGICDFRTTPVIGSRRGPWCMIGACFDCLVTIDGAPNQQACMVVVSDGMQIERQLGARDLGR